MSRSIEFFFNLRDRILQKQGIEDKRYFSCIIKYPGYKVPYTRATSEKYEWMQLEVYNKRLILFFKIKK